MQLYIHAGLKLSHDSKISPSCLPHYSLVTPYGVKHFHCGDAIMSTMASQIISLSIVCSTVCSGADQRKTSKLRVTGLCVGNSPEPVNSPHKGPVTRKMFPFDDVIMQSPLVQVLTCRFLTPTLCLNLCWLVSIRSQGTNFIDILFEILFFFHRQECFWKCLKMWAIFVRHQYSNDWWTLKTSKT